MKKYTELLPAFIIGILFLLFYKFWLTGLFFNELSYKMAGVEPRYVDKFRYTPIHKINQLENPEYLAEWENYYKKIISLNTKIENLFKWKKINESIFIYITDLWNYPMTAIYNNEKIDIKKGISKDIIPTSIFKIKKQDIDWLEIFLSDNILDEQEKLKIADVIMNSMIERLYRLSRFYKVEHLAMFKFDNFIQFEIKWWEKITIAWVPLDLNYTIVNVDWQWIVNKWLVWDPDIKISISLNDTLKLYDIMVIKLENSKTKKEAIDFSNEAFSILKDNIIYTRDDHK